MIVKYVVADDYCSMKAKLRYSYTKLMEIDPKFSWKRVNVRKQKDVGNINLYIPYQEFISYPTHQIKVLHNPFPPLARNPKKDNPLRVHMSDTLSPKKYWGWADNQQRIKDFY